MGTHPSGQTTKATYGKVAWRSWGAVCTVTVRPTTSTALQTNSGFSRLTTDFRFQLRDYEVY